jgi:hypothetical protein
VLNYIDPVNKCLVSSSGKRRHSVLKQTDIVTWRKKEVEIDLSYLTELKRQTVEQEVIQVDWLPSCGGPVG